MRDHLFYDSEKPSLKNTEENQSIVCSSLQEDSLRKKEEGRWFTVAATGIRPSAPPPPPFQSYGLKLLCTNFYRKLLLFIITAFLCIIIIIGSSVRCWTSHFIFLLASVICLFLHLGSNICSWVGDYVLLDDGGCNGDANTTKEEEEIAVSDHFPHSRHRVRMNLHLFISFFLSICTQSVLQLSVSCCYAAAALTGYTQHSNSLKTFFELPSSWCVCRA